MDARAESDDLLRTGELLVRIRAGETGAANDLLARFRPRLLALLHSRLPAAERGLLDTQDLVQEVSVKLLRALPRFEERGLGSFWSFLRRIAFDALTDVQRRAGRRGAMSELNAGSREDPSASGASPSAALRDRERFAAFESGLARVSNREREAVLLRFEVGLDYAGVAAACGYPTADAARMAIGRALAEIAKGLRDERPSE